ncbi:NUDIX hydrolase [Rhizobium sp. P32RR-XVIII]|uniref:NUDIX hydrolase n=1 Tax=Rhizobium sp. P32RR-XVIII TaxID=2726738 RepID=UPI001FEF72F7|nr:NUDIX hydrolase [Rhizobium sp. P32RR-XVIII]
MTTHLSRLASHAETILNGDAIEQFGALCIRDRRDGQMEVLLITTRETGRWSIPKGWPIKGLAPQEVVEREAWEEAGVKGRAKKRVFGYFTYLKSLEDGRQIPSFVEVHLVDVRQTKKNFPECRERKLAWVTPIEAATLVREPELKSLLRCLEKRSAA